MIGLLPALLVATQLAGGVAPPRPAKPAPVDIVIYSDFQCPFCRQFALPTREMRSNGINGVPVTITFRHFPLPFHVNAQLAHQAAEAAKAQGKFWEMHDVLFANQAHLRRVDILGYAQSLDLDLARFERDLDSETTKRAIAEDVAEGQRAGITGTPTYSINGRTYQGTRTIAQLKSLLSGDVARNPDPGSRTPARTTQVNDITDAMLSIGPSDAPVTIELFADLQSPITQAALAAAESVQHRYPAAVRVQFRSYPLPFHRQAVLAHEAAMAAARSGQFWEFTRAVLARQGAIDEDGLVEIARDLGLKENAFRDALREHRYQARIDLDRDAAARLGVRGSPVLTVNGRRIDGIPSVPALAGSVAEALTEMRGADSAGR
jgi:protein-disulfide isomerase